MFKSRDKTQTVIVLQTSLLNQHTFDEIENLENRRNTTVLEKKI